MTRTILWEQDDAKGNIETLQKKKKKTQTQTKLK